MCISHESTNQLQAYKLEKSIYYARKQKCFKVSQPNVKSALICGPV